jgi:hypothetical protein
MGRRVAGLATAGAIVGTSLLLMRPRLLRWGAAHREFEDPLPGDDLLPEADLTATRATTVGASADRVWPWIAQVRQGRGAFYSYDSLENPGAASRDQGSGIAPRVAPPFPARRAQPHTIRPGLPSRGPTHAQPRLWRRHPFSAC